MALQWIWKISSAKSIILERFVRNLSTSSELRRVHDHGYNGTLFLQHNYKTNMQKLSLHNYESLANVLFSFTPYQYYSSQNRLHKHRHSFCRIYPNFHQQNSVFRHRHSFYGRSIITSPPSKVSSSTIATLFYRHTNR